MPPRRRPALSRGQLAAVALGNGLEFYDFTVYAFFAVPIGHAFFPAANPWASLLLSVSTFGIGYFTRPLGALAIGAYADRRGSRPALVLSLALMGLATLTIAVLPAYGTLGLAAPVLMVAARLVQGFALGAETGPAITCLVGAAAGARRSRAVAWQVATNGAALLAAGLVGYGLSLALPRPALDAWGWRLAFALALATVPATLAVRARLPDGGPAAPGGAAPVRSLLARPGRAAAAVLVIASGTVSFSIAAFMTSYALTALKLAPSLAFLSAVALGAATLATAPLGGLLADLCGRRSTFLASRAALALAAVPAFAWLDAARDGPALLTVSAAIAALSTLGAPAGLCMVFESLPAGARSTGLAMAYALGISLFGGTTQAAVTALVALSGNLLWPGYYLAASSAIGAAAAFGVVSEARRSGDRGPVPTGGAPAGTGAFRAPRR